VFASHLFALGNEKTHYAAKHIVQKGDVELARQLASGRKSVPPLLPIVVTGAKEPLHAALLRGLQRSLATVRSTKGVAALLKHVARLQRSHLNGEIVNDREVIAVVNGLLESMKQGEFEYNGIFLVIDELGKILEYSAQHPTHSDVYLLQQLAELATRSDPLFLMLGVLHQDFGAYASRLSTTEQAEWEKVKGRFEDIVFEEPADEILRLLAHARDAHRSVVTKASLVARESTHADRRSFSALCDRAWRLGLAPAGMGREEFFALIHRCHPLHPIVAVALGQLFRRLAQNERSVFSFVASTEPHGLLEFLGSEGAELYTCDRMYDYMLNAFGDSLYTHRTGKRWAEIEGAIDRLPEAPFNDLFTVKVVGLLSAIGQWRNLVPTQELLELAAIGAREEVDVAKSLADLSKKSIVVHRKYNNTWALWEGSDVNVDDAIKTARDRIDPSLPITSLAARYAPLRPVVARRHSFARGTLRYFAVHFVDVSNLPSVELQHPQKADGSICVVLPKDADQVVLLQEAVRNTAIRERRDILVLVPGDGRRFENALREAACIEWVKTHVAELEGDATARRELRAREIAVLREVESVVSGLLSPLESADTPNVWFTAGRERSFDAYRDLNEFLSKVCDDLYPDTPRICNELINRRELSSAAAAARRDLIEAMIGQSATEDLGIQGTPPHKSMYLSVLKTTGMHRHGSDGWHFASPREKADAGLHAVWEAIEEFYNTTLDGAKPISELYDTLRRRPFGMRDGPLPVILCASLLANTTDVALYEDKSFVPQLTVPVFERAIRSPERFTVHRWRVTGVRATVFNQLAAMLGREEVVGAVSKDHILGIVRPLCRFAAKLNEYTLNTERLSATAKAVRTALIQAREPDQLLFEDLPAACGVVPLLPNTQLSDAGLRSFLSVLRASLGELQRAYDELLVEICGAIGVAFGVSVHIAELRPELQRRAEHLRNWVVEPSVKTFAVRAAASELDNTSWLESVAALLGEKPPPMWRDHDRARFEVALSKVSRLFGHLEALAYHKGAFLEPETDTIRVGITTRGAEELERVVRIPRDSRKVLDRLEADIRRALGDAADKGTRDIAVAALARVTRELLAE